MQSLHTGRAAIDLGACEARAIEARSGVPESFQATEKRGERVTWVEVPKAGHLLLMAVREEQARPACMVSFARTAWRSSGVTPF